MNPTSSVFEERIAKLEGGVGALATSSGQAAITLAIQNIATAGDNIVSSTSVYGGTYNLFSNTLKDQGINVKFVKADESSSEIYDCLKVKVVDTTAAGDTFCGGMAVGLSEGMSLQSACAFGSKAASIACTKKGAQQSIPYRNEL